MSDTLILNDLEIENFRAFRHLQIKHLGRVNLVVGKNNVGKTCLLEALWLYASRGSSQAIQELLKMRNEFGEDDPPILATKYLLYGRENLDEINDRRIKIGPFSTENSLFVNIVSMDQVSIKTLMRNVPSEAGKVNKITAILAQKGYDSEANELFLKTLGRRNPGGKHDFILATSVDQKTNLNSKTFEEIYSSIDNILPHQFISARSLDKVDVAGLWDKIYLTDSQDEVEEALRIIEPVIKGVGLVDSSERRQRVPQVRIPGPVNRVMLSSLGEGMERLFNLTLALVNAKDGFLLIDEIENGIHYTVQPKLWEFIFKTAHRLNVQVFATTHSWDAVQSFQDAAQEHKQTEGVLISLRNKQDAPGVVIGTIFDEEDLEVARHEHIEVR